MALSLRVVSILLSSCSPSSMAARILRSASWLVQIHLRQEKGKLDHMWSNILYQKMVSKTDQFLLHLLGPPLQLSTILPDQEAPGGTYMQ